MTSSIRFNLELIRCADLAAFENLRNLQYLADGLG